MAAQTGPDLWERVTSHDALHAAWYKVAANAGSAGGDGVRIGEFRQNLFANLTELRAEILAGTYRTGPFRRVTIPKKKPGYRILTIPSIRDRVVHTSIGQALTPILEPMFEDSSFAYRPNRGVQQAVARIEMWRKRGYNVVIEADIVSYFDNVDQAILRDKIAAAISALDGSAPIIALIDRILEDQARALGTPGRGLVQGSPLSPLLSNLYLDALDEEIADRGVKIVRFGDDFVILCKSRKKAQRVLADCVEILADHNLRLHEDGTRIVSFDEGFDFIGYLFLRSLALKKDAGAQPVQPSKPIKSTVTDEGIIELDDEGSRFDPGRRVLYVLDPGHVLDIRNRSFSVQRDDGSELIAIPHRRVGRIEVGPGVAFSHRPIELALAADIELAVIGGWGQTRGVVISARAKRAGVQFAQARAILDEAFRVAIARRLVEARIRNQRTQLMRLNRRPELKPVADCLDTMKQQLRNLPHLATIEALFGAEGSATAVYWPALGLLSKATAAEPFRRQRPANDPLNATINYLTGILERDVRAAIQASGLHQGFAFLHASRDRHDGLIYDLMEPFRAPLTEGLAVYLFNAKRLRADMFAMAIGGEFRISEDGRAAIIRGYEATVARRVNKPDEAGRLAWRPMMLHQARSLVRAVRQGDSDLFRPYVMEA